MLWSGFASGAVLDTLIWARLPVRAVVSAIVVQWGLFSGSIGRTTHVWAAVCLAFGGLAYAP